MYKQIERKNNSAWRREEKQSKDLSSKIFKNALFADSMLEAELLPELHSDLVPTLSNLQSDDLSRHIP